MSPLFFDLYSECLAKEELEELGNFKIGRRLINTTKYADDLVLLTMDKAQLHEHD